jgi:hypothetical protein
MHQSRHLFKLESLRFSILVWIIFGTYFAPFATAQHTLPKNPETTTRKDSDSFYQPNQVQVIHLQVRESDLDKMISALPRRIYVPATFRWRDQIFENVGIRYKGNSSSNPRQRHKRSFLIKFSEFEKGRSFLGLQRVALDNGVQFGSLFSEQLITGILRDLVITASRSNFAKLYLNGKYHGVYANVERIDTVFVKNNFTDGGGALYKVDEGGPGANLGPPQQHPGPANRKGLAFEAKSPFAYKDARDVLELISKINQSPTADFSKIMEETIEMDAFLQTMAVMLFSGAFDQLTGWGPHNYYLYHDPQSGRWHYLPWDLDVGFADNAFRRVPVISGWNAAWPVMGGSPSPLLERIIENPKLLARYRRFADSILEKHFHPKVLLPKVDALYERIKDDLAADPFPHQRVTNPEDQDYESIVASIKDFVRRRYDTARAQLDNPGVRPQIAKNAQRRGQEPQPGNKSADAPSGLRVASQTGFTVTLQWIDNAKGEVGHIVQRADGEKGHEFRNRVGKPGTDITTASDDSVAPGRTYRYRVYAVRPSPNGPQGTGVSNTITVRIPDK